MATTSFSHSESSPNLAPLTGTGVKLPASGSLYYQSHPRRSVEAYAFDQAYLDRLAVGDEATTEHFVAYFYKLLVVKLRARMRASNQPEDVAQETLYRVLNHVKVYGGINSPEKLGAFVNRVSENVLLEAIRQSNKFSQVPENASEPVERALDAERSYITEERKQLLRREMENLSKSDRTIIQKVFILEEDKDAICAELKIDRNYLRVQVHRALGRFRKLLAASYPTPPAVKKACAS